MKTLYAVLFVVGCVLPLSQFVPWVVAHGVDPRLFVRELFANRISGFFGLDVIVSAVVLLCLAVGRAAAARAAAGLGARPGHRARRGLRRPAPVTLHAARG